MKLRPLVLASTILASVITVPLKGETFEAKVYIKENSALVMPIHIFAVGSTYSSADYEEFGQNLSENGIIAVMFDYHLGAMFKSDEKYEENYPFLIQSIQRNSMEMKKKTSSEVIIDKDLLWLGGHSAGGKATYMFLGKHPEIELAGLSFWDPVNSFAKGPFRIPDGARVLISTPIKSGCGMFINENNNGIFWHHNTIPQTQVTFVPYGDDVAHNSLSSTGATGKITCYKRIEGFIARYAKNVASFIKA